MKRIALAVLGLAVFQTAAAAAAATCESYFVDIEGKGVVQQTLRLPDGWPRAQFVRNSPQVFGSQLRWTPEDKPPTITTIPFPGRTVVAIDYGPLDRVLAWDQGDGSLCPML